MSHLTVEICGCSVGGRDILKSGVPLSSLKFVTIFFYLPLVVCRQFWLDLFRF